MSTTLSIIAGAVVLGIAVWKGRKILVSKDSNGDYQLEIKKLSDKIKSLHMSLENERSVNIKKTKELLNKYDDLLSHVSTKGMNMKKLRAITKKNNG